MKGCGNKVSLVEHSITVILHVIDDDSLIIVTAPNGNKDLAGFPLADDLKMNLQGRNTVVVVSNFYVVSSQ